MCGRVAPTDHGEGDGARGQRRGRAGIGVGAGEEAGGPQGGVAALLIDCPGGETIAHVDAVVGLGRRKAGQQRAG